MIALRRGRLTSWRQNLVSESQPVHTAPSPGRPRSVRRVLPAPSRPERPGKPCGAGGLRWRSNNERGSSPRFSARSRRACAPPPPAGSSSSPMNCMSDCGWREQGSESGVTGRTQLTGLEPQRERVQQRTLYALRQARRVSTASVRPRCVTRAVWLTAS